MWLFESARGDEVNGGVNDEHDALGEEADELRLKLEALRMAEHREAQRIACGLKVPGGAESTSSGSRAAPQAPAQHFTMEDTRHDLSPSHGRDLEFMYDFSNFASHGHQDTADTSQHQAPGTAQAHGQARADEEDLLCVVGDADLEADDDEEVELERLRTVEAKLRQQEEDLVAEAELQDKKLVSAARALQRTREQLRQLTDELEKKDKTSAKFNASADALEMLLVEKERRLMAALVEASAALDEEPAENEVTLPQRQAQEAKTNVHEEQLLQMTAMTEELTDALMRAADGEKDARRQLTAAAVRFKDARDQRVIYEHELAAEVAKHEEDYKIFELKQTLQAQERILAWEHARVKEHEAFWDPKHDVIKHGQEEFPTMQV